MPESQSFEPDASMSEDAAVQILYNLSSDGHLSGSSPHQHHSEQQESGTVALSCLMGRGI